MVAAPMVLPSGKLAMAFAGGSGIGIGSGNRLGGSTATPSGNRLGGSTATTADVLDAGATLVTPLAAMPYGHSDDGANTGVEVMGLTFICGSGGNVSVWNSTQSEWLPNTWSIAARGALACSAATSSDGTKGYVACGGGEMTPSDQLDVFVVGGVAGAGTSIRQLTAAAAAPRGAPKLCQGRKKLSAAGQADILMLAGGYSDVEPKGYMSKFDMFNASTNTWTSGSWPSGIGRQYGVGVGCGGMLLFGGGQQSGGRSGVVDIYDVRDGGRWLPPAHLNGSRSNLAGGCMADRYAVFGGGQCTGHDKDRVEALVDVYDTVTNTWGTLPPLNFGRGKLAGTGAGGCVGFAGGHMKPASAADLDVHCVDTR